MARPQFTDDEEKLISYCRIHTKTRGDYALHWLILVIISNGLFWYGFFKEINAYIFTGFIIAMYQLCRLIYYQLKPSWQIAPIIQKYEDALKEDSQQ